MVLRERTELLKWPSSHPCMYLPDMSRTEASTFRSTRQKMPPGRVGVTQSKPAGGTKGMELA